MFCVESWCTLQLVEAAMFSAKTARHYFVQPSWGVSCQRQLDFSLCSECFMRLFAAAACPDPVLPANAERARDDLIIIRCNNLGIAMYFQCVNGRWQVFYGRYRCGESDIRIFWFLSRILRNAQLLLTLSRDSCANVVRYLYKRCNFCLQSIICVYQNLCTVNNKPVAMCLRRHLVPMSLSWDFLTLRSRL